MHSAIAERREPDARRRPGVLARLRDFLGQQAELAERRSLLDRPWEEQFLHWAYDGHEWRLHGHRLPPPGRRAHSTTRTGWCPGIAAASTRSVPG